tara:strand:+ start:1481 stop:1969 length:489 start_codon:yes stop_codon:yes gene_type:complete
MIEQTLILIKPDGVQRGLIGDILKRFEQRGLKIVGLKMVQTTKDQAKEHYREEIAEKYGERVLDYLVDFVTSTPVIAIVVQGSGAIATVRKIVGSTYPGEADLGTIRGDFNHTTKEYAKANDQGHNLIHASENEEAAKRELALWFSIDEIHDYKLSHEEHVF